MITRKEADEIVDVRVTQSTAAMLQRHFGLQLGPPDLPDLSGPVAPAKERAGHG